MSKGDTFKRMAAEAAVTEVTDGMIVGLGTGSTTAHAIASLGERCRAGLHIEAIPTSEDSAAKARALGIPLTTLEAAPRIDLTIDGADEVDTTTLGLVKGLGGALLREKIVAAASARLLIVVGFDKLVPALGHGVRLPVEIVRFGASATLRRLEALNVRPTLRRIDGEPFISDGGNFIADCETGMISDPSALHVALKSTLGVIDTGLFIGMASRVYVGTRSGLRVLEARATGET